MRFKQTKDGDTRYRKRFLWLPFSAWDQKEERMETRWLEKVEYKETYYCAPPGPERLATWLDISKEKHG